MTVDMIDAAARQNEPLSDSAGLSDRQLYHCLVMLYREYRVGIIDVVQAKREKQRLIDIYKNNALWERIFREHSRRMKEIGKLSNRAEHDGCPICKQMARIFDGRQREAEE